MGWGVTDRLYEGNGAEGGGVGSFVRRKRSGGWEESERLYGAVGEKSIDFPRTPYRLFPDSSVVLICPH